jgi:predicted RNase H-like HicB family nuclease
MHSTRRLTAVTWREGNGYVALCPDVDVASQGDTVQEARANLTEALQLFLETASPAELAERLRIDVEVSPLEVAVGQ